VNSSKRPMNPRGTNHPERTAVEIVCKGRASVNGRVAQAFGSLSYARVGTRGSQFLGVWPTIGKSPHIRVLRLMHSCYPPCKQRKGGAPSIAVISANRRAGSCPFPFFGSESRDNFYVAGWHCILLDRTDRDLPQRGRIAGDTSRIIGGPARSIPWRPKTLLTQIKKTNRPRVGKLSREVGLGESNSSRCTKRSRLP